MNKAIEWVVERWETIVNVFIWGFSFLMGCLLVWMIYKIIKLRFEFIHVFGLVISVAWVFIIMFFGFEDVRQFLEGIVSYDAMAQ